MTQIQPYQFQLYQYQVFRCQVPLPSQSSRRKIEDRIIHRPILRTVYHTPDNYRPSIFRAVATTRSVVIPKC